MRFEIAVISAMLLAACGRSAGGASDRNDPGSAPPAAGAQAPSAPAAPEAPKPSLPDDRTPLEEPDGPMDPKSVEAAGQVVQHYAALMEQKRFAEAETYWSGPAAASAINAKLRSNRENHFEIGKPGDAEGAAGSSYVTVPVISYGKDSTGKDYRRSADIILRRVNDVAGSTEAKRRWHIERIDWK